MELKNRIYKNNKCPECDRKLIIVGDSVDCSNCGYLGDLN